MAATGDGDAARIDVAEGARPTPAASDEGGRSFVPLALGALVVAVLGAGAFLALSSGSHTTMAQRGEAPPVIRAEDRPFKVSPGDPGGLDVPNRDKLVYSRLKGTTDMPEVERLLPGPERPLPLPEQPVAVTAAPSTAAAPVAGAAAPRAALDGGLPPAEAATGVPPASLPAPDLAMPDHAMPDLAAPGLAAPGLAAPSLAAEPAVPVVMLRPVARPAVKPVEAASAAKRVSTVTLAKAEQKPAAGTKALPETKLASLDTKPPAQEAAKSAGGGHFQVQLGAMSSPELARAHWAKLLASHGDILGRLQPSVARADLGEKGTFYRLRAGPIDGPQRAQEVCKALSGRSIGCVVVSTRG